MVHRHTEMKMIRRVALLLFLAGTLFISTSAYSDDVIVQEFAKGSLKDIREQRKDQPFILVFWSKDCGYCLKEMNLLASLQPKHPELDVVLVSTDAGLAEKTVKHFFNRTGIEADEIWLFSDNSPRLYTYVDSSWRGELPNTLFHNSKHEYQSVVGEVNYKLIKNWLHYIKKEDS